MGKGKRILVLGFLIGLIMSCLLATTVVAGSSVYYGKVVGFVFTVMQVEEENGIISVFWVGHRSHLDSRAPFFGDRVRIKYVKDALGRNAVTRIAVFPHTPSARGDRGHYALKHMDK